MKLFEHSSGANLREEECIRGKKRSWNSTTEVVTLHRPAIRIRPWELLNTIRQYILVSTWAMVLTATQMSQKHSAKVIIIPVINYCITFLSCNCTILFPETGCKKTSVHRLECNETCPHAFTLFHSRGNAFISERWRATLTIQPSGASLSTSLVARHLNCCSGGAWD